jgi:hypothetical protein
MIIRRLKVNGNAILVYGLGARRNKEGTKLLLEFFLCQSARMIEPDDPLPIHNHDGRRGAHTVLLVVCLAQRDK